MNEVGIVGGAHDPAVLVVGAGPAGCAAATTLAAAGHHVTVVERAARAADQPCGELLEPRTLWNLAGAGLPIEALEGGHPVTHVRFSTGAGEASTARQRTTSLPWPAHEQLPSHALVVPRPRLAAVLHERAESTGASLQFEHEAIAPIVERGFVRGAIVSAPDGSLVERRADFTIVADGANSRFGRELGTYRQPEWPSALAHRAIYRSALHDAAEVELVLDLTDRAGTPITGFGWMFPRGDGTVNVGVLMLSTSPSFHVVDPARLLEHLVTDHGRRWQLADAPTVPAGGGRIPMGSSITPAAGPTYVVVGDAIGVANPLSGAGIGAAFASGAAAGEIVGEAIRTGDSAALQRYPKLLRDRYGSYHKVGRLAVRMLGRPSINRRLAGAAASRQTVAEGLVRISGQQLRRAGGLPELTYRLARAATALAPDA